MQILSTKINNARVLLIIVKQNCLTIVTTSTLTVNKFLISLCSREFHNTFLYTFLRIHHPVLPFVVVVNACWKPNISIPALFTSVCLVQPSYYTTHRPFLSRRLCLTLSTHHLWTSNSYNLTKTYTSNNKKKMKRFR